jgi:hypothetical protein
MFLDPDHPKGLNAVAPATPTPLSIQAIYQRMSAEIVLQLALFPPGREALFHEAELQKALEQVAESGMTPEAREHAQGTLLALSDKEMQASDSKRPKHIMLSYQVRTVEPPVC